ncbi:MAG TPA: UxaA family hydrolase, partial [Bryobacteraceae bacterium]|nr:UxaA family hydrolase [Bryobacteraceae bacterium]
MSTLLGIHPAPSAENVVVRLHPSDNVAVVRVPLSVGTEVRVGGETFTAKNNIPPGHKVAVKTIRAGENVIRYGQRIGRAKCDIAIGEHIHTHNLGFEELEFAYEFPEGDSAVPAPPANGPSFLGYLREDGRVGTRNYVAVVAASNCAAHTAEKIAESFRGESLPGNIDGVVAFPHGD